MGPFVHLNAMLAASNRTPQFGAIFASNVPSESLEEFSSRSPMTVVKLRGQRSVSPQPVGSNELILTNPVGDGFGTPIALGS
jgi:hypothetical protein